MIDCAGCVVHISDERKVVIEGLKDYIVAEKNGQLLICRLQNEQMIKEWGR
jgi:mannose-1-phosphate guanylyltransferase